MYIYSVGTSVKHRTENVMMTRKSIPKKIKMNRPILDVLCKRVVRVVNCYKKYVVRIMG